MAETKQPTPIDAALYSEFKEFVKENHGQLRGSLRDELENAIRQYMDAANGPDKLEKIERDLETIKRQVTSNGADGGPTLSQDETTHTHRSGSTVEPTGAESSTTEPSAQDVPDERPHAKASRDRKAAWVASQFDLDGTAELHRVAIESKIDDAYSFNDDATASLTDAVAQRLGLVHDHPEKDGYLVDEGRLDQLLEELEDDETDEADATFEELEQAEPVSDGGRAHTDEGEFDVSGYRLEQVEDLVADLAAEHTEGAPRRRVIVDAATGYAAPARSTDHAEALLAHLMDEGRVCEPREGILRTVEGGA